jgi:hypothetical protein
VKISDAKPNPAPIILLYGSEGRGKSTLAFKSPNPVAILSERGIPRGVTVPAFDAISKNEDVLKAISDLIQEPHDYRSLVIDTLDSYEPMLLDYVCRMNGWKTIEQPSYGRGYVAADDEWRRFIRGTTALRDKRDMTIVFVCHAEIITVNDPRAPSYTSYMPKLHKRARSLLMDGCDIVGFLGDDLRTVTDDNDRVRASAGPARYLFTEGSPSFSAKNRFAMPSKIAIPQDFDFAHLAQYWAPTEDK